MEQLALFKKKRLQAAMERHNLQALIASLPENIYYLSGYESVGHRILNRTQIFSLYVPAQDKLVLVIPTAEIPTAQERFPNTEMVAFGEFFFAFPPTGAEAITEVIAARETNAGQALIKALTACGIAAGRVGLDEGRTNPQLWQSLAEAMPQVEWVPGAMVFNEARKVKHPDEVALLERAAEIAEEALLTALAKVDVDTTELDIERFYREEVSRRGADPYFGVFTIDERSALADTINTSLAVREGSIIGCDFGCVYRGYRSDLARTAVFGKSEAKVEEYYKAILVGEEKAVEGIRPGVPAEEIFHIAVNETKKAGIPHYRRHHCGHGIGLETYDFPSIAPGVQMPLEAGMVLCIETPYYEIGWGGVQVEDAVLVTEKGARYLSKSSRELIRLG